MALRKFNHLETSTHYRQLFAPNDPGAPPVYAFTADYRAWIALFNRYRELVTMTMTTSRCVCCLFLSPLLVLAAMYGFGMMIFGSRFPVITCHASYSSLTLIHTIELIQEGFTCNHMIDNLSIQFSLCSKVRGQAWIRKWEADNRIWKTSIASLECAKMYLALNPDTSISC